MNERYIETASGLLYHFEAPSPDEIDIEDIAFALSNKCRFSGHTQFFSVAEHSLSVAHRLPPELRLAGLLHDAAEAYLGDIPSPLKAVLPDYRSLEDINEIAIAKKFNVVLDIYDKSVVKRADVDALFTEAYYLLPSKGKDWSMFQNEDFEVLSKYAPQCLPPHVAYKIFMDAYEHFTGTGKQLQLIMA